MNGTGAKHISSTMTCQFPSALPAVATNMTNETTRYSISTASVSGSLTVPILQPRHPPVGMHVTPRGGFPLRVLYKFSSYISAETPKSPPRNYQQSLTRLLLLIHRPSRTHPQTPDSHPARPTITRCRANLPAQRKKGNLHGV